MLEMRRSLQQYYLNKAGLTPSVVQAETKGEPPADMKPDESFVNRVRAAIEEHMADNDFTVEQLCRKVYMSHSQLHRKLDALTGISPNKFIRMIRLQKARQMMKDPAKSIASVAYECGYNDPGYFARVFKQEYGETPQEWRSKQ